MHKLSSQKDFVKRGDITLKSNKSQIGNYIGLESKDSAIDAKINENDLYLVEIRDTKGNVLSSSYTKAVRHPLLIYVKTYNIVFFFF